MGIKLCEIENLGWFLGQIQTSDECMSMKLIGMPTHPNDRAEFILEDMEIPIMEIRVSIRLKTSASIASKAFLQDTANVPLNSKENFSVPLTGVEIGTDGGWMKFS